MDGIRGEKGRRGIGSEGKLIGDLATDPGLSTWNVAEDVPSEGEELNNDRKKSHEPHANLFVAAARQE